MYNFILCIFIVISCILILLIIFNNLNYDNFYNYNNKFNFLDFIYHDSFINIIIKILVFLFLFFSILICFLNHKIYIIQK
ncbi:Protein-export membrane protein SecG [Buchnera aphidicola (Pterocallis alni)]